MLNLSLFQNIDLPYEPLPQAAYDAVRLSLLKCDFSENAILNDYSFSSRSKEHTIKINALAFAHPTHRTIDYAGLTLFNAVNSQSDEALVSILAESAAPFHIIHRDDQFSFWTITVHNNQIEPIHIQSHISYDQLDNILSNYADDIKPQRIINAKQGRDTFTIFRNVQPLQLSFWAADVTRPLLVKYFAQAVEVLRSHINHHDIRISDQVVTNIAIQLLGATILADTGVFGNEMRLKEVSLNKLIHKANSSFPSYFQSDIFDEHFKEAEQAYQLLRQIRYAGFTPDMLSYLWTKAYSKEERKKSGRYDTPLYLTRRIWENIPVEYLPPDQRIIADMTCGWGSFLISGYERLSNLSDIQTSLLRQQLRGNDNNHFTAKLAGLGLLLSTSEDSWHIDYQDGLRWNWLDTHQPNIIVGNPPFGANRKESFVDTQKRYQKADDFLKRAIERLAPKGYLAMLMPGSFMGAEASPWLRKQLLEKCDVLELWELPLEVFPEATAQTIVVFAQKKAETHDSSNNPVRVRTLQPNTLKNFKISGTFTASDLVVNQSAWNETARKSKHSKNTHIMDYRITLPEHTWREIASHCVNLRENAEVIRGAIIGQKTENKRWRNYSFPKNVPWLTGVKKVIKRPFQIDYTQASTILYPNNLEEPRKSRDPEKDREYVLAGEKVLIAYDPHPSWGRRMKIAIESRGYYVSDSFWIVTPKPTAQKMHISHEVLAAVLSWDVSNAWVIEHLTSPSIPVRAINTIPFPSTLSEKDCNALTAAVREIEEEASDDKDAPLAATQRIDSILQGAYHLDDATFERLRKISEWDRNPESTLDTEPDREKANWFLSGIVDSVNAEQGTITMWMEGFHELQTVQIVSSMPGWMLRPGAAFRTKIPDGYVDAGRIDPNAVDWDIFRPQPYIYMTEEELLEELSNLLHEDDKNRIG